MIIILATAILVKFIDGGPFAAFLCLALAVLLSYGLARHWEVTPVIKPLEQLWDSIMNWRKPKAEEKTEE